MIDLKELYKNINDPPYSLENWPKSLPDCYLPFEKDEKNALSKVKSLMMRVPDAKILQNNICNINIKNNHFNKILPNIKYYQLDHIKETSEEFDSYILYDLIDNIEYDVAKDLLNFLYTKRKKIYIFCHPYRSRFCKNVFNFNLAYFHLYFENTTIKNDLINPYEIYIDLLKDFDILIENSYSDLKEEQFKITTSPFEYIEFLIKPKLNFI